MVNTLKDRTFRCAKAFALLVSTEALLVGLAVPGAAAPGDDGWDPTLPKLISAGAPGDPLAIANASLEATAQATQITMDLGRNFLSSIGLGGSPASVAPGRVRGRQAGQHRHGQRDAARIGDAAAREVECLAGC